MAKIHLANFVEIRHWLVSDDDEQDEGDWIVVNQFQNANTETKIRHENCDWPFLSFIYSGATRTRTGDNIEAALMVSTNQVSMDFAYDIVVPGYSEKQHHIKRQIRVQTCLLNDDFTKVDRVINTEYWLAASMSYDAEAVELLLSSAIDAVFAGLPNTYLNEQNVGRLPTTGRVSTS